MQSSNGQPPSCPPSLTPAMETSLSRLGHCPTVAGCMSKRPGCHCPQGPLACPLENHANSKASFILGNSDPKISALSSNTGAQGKEIALSLSPMSGGRWSLQGGLAKIAALERCELLRESCGAMSSVAPPRTERTWPLRKECIFRLKQCSPNP